jgi:putative transposase
VFLPPYRHQALYGQLRAAAGRIVREPCDQKGVALLEGHAAAGHVRLSLSIPPQYRVAYTVGFLKGKSAVRLHRELLRERRVAGRHFWATGYGVSTVGRDEEAVRKYIWEQEGWEREQGELFE